MYALRIRIYQPQAHYRIPFTYQRRHTYPIPPYSTVIGFLCNVLGIDSQEKEDYKTLRRIQISIAGRFESKTTEYIWFRNLSRSAHVDRFGFVENRSIGGHLEHIGGQSPVLIDILNEVRLIIYLAHEDKLFLEKIKSELENPIHRLDVLHLGRAEDWVVFEEVSEVFQLPNECKRRDGDYRHFFWIPESFPAFKDIDGLLYQLPTFWEVEGFAESLNRHGRRIFDYIQAKLNDGVLTQHELLLDNDFPVFLAGFTRSINHA